MSSEYDTLYSLLEDLIKKNKTTDAPITISAIIPEIEAMPKKRGRPHGSKTKKTRCLACMEKFHIDTLGLHQDTSIACKKFNALEEKPPIVAYPIHQLIITALDNATTVGTTCRFCETVIIDIKQHMTESQVCNRMAYAEFKKTI